MVIDHLPFNAEEVFYSCIPKFWTLFDDNPFGYLKYLSINKDFAGIMTNKIPKIMIQREYFRIIYLPSLYCKESKIRNVESHIIEEIATEMIFEGQTKVFLQKNRTQWCVLNIEEIITGIAARRRKANLQIFNEKLLTECKLEMINQQREIMNLNMTSSLNTLITKQKPSKDADKEANNIKKS